MRRFLPFLVRLLYSCATALLLPFVLLRLLWRSRREPGYALHWRERLGIYGQQPPIVMTGTPRIWLHAVSLGETRAAAPFIDALLARYPAAVLLLTHMTATGREAGSLIAAKHPGRIKQLWLPYDLPMLLRGFFRYFKPQLGVVMETEVWPNMLHVAKQQRLPLLLANARLSEKSARGYARFSMLARPALGAFSAVLAQTPADAARLQLAGAHSVQVVGNIKFDALPDSAQLAAGRALRCAIGRPVLLAASTREGEERLLLEQLALCRAAAVLLVLVPRHPQRFSEVELLLKNAKVYYKKYSDICNTGNHNALNNLPKNCDVLLGDSMGEMPFYFGMASIAIMGGSLLPFGSQNLIEACACACPVVLGPSTYNFALAAADAIAAGAAWQTLEPMQAVPLALEKLAKPVATPSAVHLQQAGQAALAFAASQRGAVARHLAAVQSLLSPAASQ